MRISDRTIYGIWFPCDCKGPWVSCWYSLIYCSLLCNWFSFIFVIYFLKLSFLIFFFRYRIEDLIKEQKYLVNMNIKICLEANKTCLIDVSVFKNTKLPQKPCEWRTNFIDEGVYVGGWVGVCVCNKTFIKVLLNYLINLTHYMNIMHCCIKHC